MQFISIFFLFMFLPATFITYYFVKDRFKNLILFLASFFLYFWIEPVFIWILLTVILVTYGMGLLINLFKRYKIIQTVIFAINIFIIIFIFILFGYSEITPLKLLDLLEEKTTIVNFIVPFGLSIYLLQAVSYTVDLYLEKVKVQKNIINMGLYLSFFPQMVFGPVVRYSEMQSELSHRECTPTKVAKGFGMFIRGLAKIILLAFPSMLVWNNISEIPAENLSVMSSWFGILLFSYGIYFMLSGFTQLGRGLAKIFGFEFPISFNYPYSAKSIVDFWRRWNITITMWFKVYIIGQMRGAKDSFLTNIFKLLSIWILMSLWYGLSVNFLFWAIYMAFFVIIEKFFLSNLLEKLPVTIQRIYAYLTILIGWVLFSGESLTNSFSYLKSMFWLNGNVFIDNYALFYLSSFFSLFVVLILASLQKYHIYTIKLEMDKPKLSLALKNIFEILLFVLCVIFLISSNFSTETIFMLQ